MLSGIIAIGFFHVLLAIQQTMSVCVYGQNWVSENNATLCVRMADWMKQVNKQINLMKKFKLMGLNEAVKLMPIAMKTVK